MPSTQLLATALKTSGATVIEASGESWRPILGQKFPEIETSTKVLSRLGWVSFKRGLRWVQVAEASGADVINSSESLLCAHDKFSAAARLQNHQVAIVPSLLVRPDQDNVLEVLRSQNWQAPLVAKLLNGSQGKGVALLRESRDLEAWVDLLRTANREFLIQPLVQAPEFRALVVGKQVVAVAEKSASADDFRANFHRQGAWKLAEIPRDENSFILKACQAVGLDLAGVDYFRTKNGPQILEINPFPGWEGLASLDPKVPEILAQGLLELPRHRSVGRIALN